MKTIKNPILPGFNPDPSIIRVGEDYYIATSTFEWFPGVQIHHSKDLMHWKLVARPLNRVSQLDMRGNSDSGGIFAPCLSYDKGIFYLIYTDVKYADNLLLDTHNYMVTTTDILGVWSDPVYLNSSGFDPSLFHDEDGRKWLVNMTWDFRLWKKLLAGILLQEYSPTEKKLVGPITNIFQGSELEWPEGPHIYKRDGTYYLIVAEGGTGLWHAVTMARSKLITGPYEIHPDNPVLTSRNRPGLEIQKAGHGDIVETQHGEWYLVHLGARPLPTSGRCILGRETCIQKVKWCEDGWLRLETGDNKPYTEVPAPALPEHPWEKNTVRDDFQADVLDIHFQSLRVPLGEEMLSLKERPGYLRLKGMDSLTSWHSQSLVARRQQAFCYTAETCVEFEPATYKQMAGLVSLYNTANFFYLMVTHNEELGKCLSIMRCNNRQIDFPIGPGISIEGCKRCYLRVEMDYERLQFYYSVDGVEWNKTGDALDASILTDEYGMENRTGWFTGAFVGLCCQDMSGQRLPADFDYFEYIERDGNN